jgi:hypothetical protein
MRSGILSDENIKRNNPAFFHLDIGRRKHLQPSFLQKHTFNGTPTNFTRVHYRGGRPLNDLNNFANFSNNFNDAYSNSISNLNNISIDKNLHTERKTDEVDLIELKPFLSAQMRRTIKKISDGDDRVKLLNDLLPVRPQSRLQDEVVLSKLNKMYRDDTEQLEVIERAYHAAGSEIALAN